MEENKIIQVPDVTQDELWKGIIESMFEDFLHFFFPEFVSEIDFEKEFEFLNRELQELTPASESKNRRADLLVKVFLKNGEEKWLLIHIEIQGYYERDFPLRMYIYNYRIFDRFNADVMALAILTDDNANYRPSFYERRTGETLLRYEFKTYKLLDHEEAEFENSTNVFAAAMQVARRFIHKKPLKTDEDLLSLKLELFQKMLKKGFERDKIRQLANFIKWYVSFENSQYFFKFEDEFHKITKNESTMGIIDLIEKKTADVAREIGRSEGLSQGLSRGISQERRNTVRNLQAKGFEMLAIADILRLSISEVQKIIQEIEAQSHFKNGLTVAQVREKLAVEGQKNLISENRLEELYEEMMPH